MKKRNYLLPAVVLLVVSGLLSSCLKDQVSITTINYLPKEYEIIQRTLRLPPDHVSFQVVLPAHMRRVGMAPPAISDAKAMLGRVLFYDNNLSKNNAVSCASCHKQELAFSDDVAFSEGFNGQHTRRNSLALAAVANFESSYNSPSPNGGSFSQPAGFFWDERARNIADQSRLTIQDDIEMGMDLNELSVKLSGMDYYQVLFRRAYGNDLVTPDRILQALQEFVNAFVSVESRFDKGMDLHGTPFSDFGNFSHLENTGKQLFLKHCASCHGDNMSTLQERVANNGLDLEYADQGLAGITRMVKDEGVFKVPFLRNITLTGPYMHDGRFQTLGEVVEHYNSGIQAHPNLDFRLRDPADPSRPLRLYLSDTEKQALVEFLGTLTDERFTRDERFSDPFIR